MNIVALRCTFSMRARCLIVYGDHTLLQYSSFGWINAKYRSFLVLTCIPHIITNSVKEAKSLVGLGNGDFIVS